MQSVTLVGDGGEPATSIRMGTSLTVRVEYTSSRPITPVLGLVVKNNYGMPLFGINNHLVRGFTFESPSRAGEIACRLRDLPLMPDTYALDLYFGDGYQDHDVVHDAATFEVVAADVFGTGKLPGPECGSFYWPATWTHHPAEEPVGLKVER